MKNKAPLLSLQNFALAFTRENLISPFSLSIFERQRYCLVGQNGCGKSSFLKALSGDHSHVKGGIAAKAHLRISYLSQKEEYYPNISAAEFILKSLSEEELQTKAYDVNIFLDIFKIKGEAEVSTLSGGNQRRLSVIKALIKESDLLLLDEPTNHLDVTTIEWLENYINKLNSAVIVISHDREFLNNTTNNTIWIDRGKVYLNSSGYRAYEDWSSQIIEVEISQLQKLSKEVEKENLWLHQGVTARRKRNQHRLKKVFQLREKFKDNSANVRSRLSKITVKDLAIEQASKIAVDLDNVSFGYDEHNIIKNFSYRIIHGDKIGIIGVNGSGKSTLVKLITGELKPCSGTIYFGPKTSISYFEQDRKSLDTSKTPWEVLCPDGGDHIKVGNNIRHVVSYLKDFLFTSDKIKTTTELLSGGEQNRLLLARALANPGNFIILDEPTNDLDSDTLDMLLETLSDFDGTVVVVSHDRDFLEKLVTRTIIFEDNKIIDNFGGYLDYKKTVEQKKIQPKTTISSSTKQTSNNFSYKFKLELEKLAKIIPHLEEIISETEKSLEDSKLYSENPAKFTELTSLLESKKAELDIAETRWLELTILYTP